VLGPLRDYTQVEVSKTDCRVLGIDARLALSGELENASEITIIGEYGEVTKKCAIVHDRHVHASFEDKEKYDLKDTCDIYIEGEKPTILKDVKIVYGDYNLELHLDTDDGNGCNLKTGDQVELK
jgi:Propanediol utilization protein